MHRFVAFLRGMNVGGHRLKNDQLCAAFEELGFVRVSAFLASGNVLFTSPDRSEEGVAGRIEEGLRSRLGYDVPTFLRTADAVREIAGRRPFEEAWLAAGGKPQVAMLARAPNEEARQTVLALSSEEDRLALIDQELHWLPRGGLSQSELDFKALDAALGPMTVRTQRTVERLVARLG